MNAINLLAASQNVIEVAVDGIGTVDLQWIGYVISWIFNVFSGVPCGIVLGVVLFTIILKTVVLPLDVYSRVKMKKQSLMMESMRPQMEKLQKQYANDKNMYSQKVMELQRANGYNPLGACLPTIISLIIFMIVFSAFSQYSQYANLSSYNNMTVAYSGAVQEYVLSSDRDENDDKYFLLAAENDGNVPKIANVKIEDGKYIGTDGKEVVIKSYFVDFNKFFTYYNKEISSGDYGEEWQPLEGSWLDKNENEKRTFVRNFVRLHARDVAADYYTENRAYSSFLWIGSVWYPDSMFNKEIPSFGEFRNAISRAAGSIDANYEESYNEVTYNLTARKNAYNGYFVLIVLAIGLMFLQQFIGMRSQKAANELSTVDGDGARTNKMMMIMMPIIFGFFSFMYSAAFSVYMIVNTVYSILSTLIINKIVSVRYEKKTEKQESLRQARRSERKRLK